MLGKAIRDRRMERELKMTDLEQIIGYGQAGISYIETGKRIPSEKTLEKICNALDLDFNEMMVLRDLKKNTITKKVVVEQALNVGIEKIHPISEMVEHGRLQGRCIVCDGRLEMRGLYNGKCVLTCQCGFEMYVPYDSKK